MKSGVWKKSISLKLINGGPNKIQGVGENGKINKWGDVYLASQSMLPKSLKYILL